MKLTLSLAAIVIGLPWFLQEHAQKTSVAIAQSVGSRFVQGAMR